MRLDRLFAYNPERERWVQRRKNEIQTKTISLWLLLYYYYYCCGEYGLHIYTQLGINQWSLLQSFCISVSFPRCDHYLRIAQILFIANECWMITAPSTTISLFLYLPYTYQRPLGYKEVHETEWCGTGAIINKIENYYWNLLIGEAFAHIHKITHNVRINKVKWCTSPKGNYFPSQNNLAATMKLIENGYSIMPIFFRLLLLLNLRRNEENLGVEQNCNAGVLISEYFLYAVKVF